MPPGEAHMWQRMRGSVCRQGWYHYCKQERTPKFRLEI